MKIFKLAQPVLKNSVGLLLLLLAVFGFIAFLIPDYTLRFGETTLMVSVGIVIGFGLALLTCLYTVLTKPQ
ncbi:lipopolysaccharide export LptBFGC system permease protein LptF [Bacillus aryabhattai]|uniref:Lipopolysaccharide export LptBFGC system permease protein LptF n=1 Tax=Priestia aryabhattai TaxID=412384 RepID=A0A7W3NHN3_PRIAR|nr:hypothetical protein [Priestia aryabhattai]MBA9043108.1 lipopolysaccharide export LptBFGC system permease protein LptF [Priestia aryabhattai]